MRQRYMGAGGRFVPSMQQRTSLRTVGKFGFISQPITLFTQPI